MLDTDVKTISAANTFIGANAKETSTQKIRINGINFLFIAPALIFRFSHNMHNCINLTIYINYAQQIPRVLI